MPEFDPETMLCWERRMARSHPYKTGSRILRGLAKKNPRRRGRPCALTVGCLGPTPYHEGEKSRSLTAGIPYLQLFPSRLKLPVCEDLSEVEDSHVIEALHAVVRELELPRRHDTCGRGTEVFHVLSQSMGHELGNGRLDDETRKSTARWSESFVRSQDEIISTISITQAGRRHS